MPDPIIFDQTQVSSPPPTFPEMTDIPTMPQESNPIDIPPIITESKIPKKGRGKIIATILGVLLLVGAVGAGVVLVGQKQLFEQKAAQCDPAECNSPGEYICQNGTMCCTGGGCPSWVCEQQTGCTWNGANNTCDGTECTQPSPNDTCGYCLGATPTTPPGATSTPTPTHTPTPTATPTGSPTPTPTVPACSAVKAYDTNWNLLTEVQLSALSAGDIVRFTVSGTPADQIDKARFTINGVLGPEVTTKKPGTDEYYIEYTIPPLVTSFTVTAQIHHLTLGWF